MTTEPPGAPAAAAPLVQRLHIQGHGADRLLTAGASYRIGRDPQADIVLTDPRVSWQHAVIEEHGGTWMLQDAGSTNGTFVNRQRVRQVTFTGSCAVRLGHPEDGPLLNCSLAGSPDGAPGAPVRVQAATAVWQPDESPDPGQPASPPAAPQRLVSWDRSPSAVLKLPTRQLRIGRASDNEIVVSDLGVSRHHAELRRTSRGYEIVDLDSHNGTYLNGQRITAAPVTETDLIGIGPATFRLLDGQLQEFIDTGDISLSARDLTVRLSSGRVLLDHVTFSLGEALPSRRHRT